MRSIQHLQTTMLLGQTNELDAGQDRPSSQLRNFQIASLSIPKNRKGLQNKGAGQRDQMLHGLTGTCPSEVFGDRTNTIKKRRDRSR